MLTHHRKPVCLSVVSTDLPIWSVIRTAATLYQKDADRFHLLLTEPETQNSLSTGTGSSLSEEEAPPLSPSPRLLWLEISRYRVIMTMQGSSKFSYRHFWEQGVYGVSRYWLQGDLMDTSNTLNGQMRLRNFTRSLTLQGNSLPTHLRVEYELWSDRIQLGCYVLNLEIQH